MIKSYFLSTFLSHITQVKLKCLKSWTNQFGAGSWEGECGEGKSSASQWDDPNQQLTKLVPYKKAA